MGIHFFVNVLKFYFVIISLYFVSDSLENRKRRRNSDSSHNNWDDDSDFAPYPPLRSPSAAVKKNFKKRKMTKKNPSKTQGDGEIRKTTSDGGRNRGATAPPQIHVDGQPAATRKILLSDKIETADTAEDSMNKPSRPSGFSEPAVHAGAPSVINPELPAGPFVPAVLLSPEVMSNLQLIHSVIPTFNRNDYANHMLAESTGYIARCISRKQAGPSQPASTAQPLSTAQPAEVPKKRGRPKKHQI